tara:strand:- start:2839 stop:3285 length:447 start_codon:yes stop_codon:yes gene_type:complete
MDRLIQNLPHDIQKKILTSVVAMRKPKVISVELMDEISFHSGLLNNIFKKTQIIDVANYHLRYINISLLAYYFVWVINDESFEITSYNDEGFKFNEQIHLEYFIIHNELNLINILLLLRKCWLLMCLKERLKMHKQLTKNITDFDSYP